MQEIREGKIEEPKNRSSIRKEELMNRKQKEELMHGDIWKKSWKNV